MNSQEKFLLGVIAGAIGVLGATARPGSPADRFQGSGCRDHRRLPWSWARIARRLAAKARGVLLARDEEELAARPNTFLQAPRS